MQCVGRLGTVRPAVVRALAAGTQQSSHPTLTMLRKEASIDSLEEGDERTGANLISSGIEKFLFALATIATNREVAQKSTY